MTDAQSFDTLKALFVTFGCKLNFAESSTVARTFAARGIRRASPGETPDIVVVNTCSVTEMADKKCRQAIKGYVRRYPGATVLVTGCYAQLKGEQIAAIPGVDIVVGNDHKTRLDSYLADWMADRRSRLDITPTPKITEFEPSCSGEDRTRYFLKVQDGCDYWCSYCTIPRARGRSRSGTIPQLVEQARQVADEGGREIVLTGVNIGDFGHGRDDTFFDLIRALDRVDGIERYRISSIEPNLLTDEIIDWVATESRAFMPHFHVPLQAGSDEVLRLMGRRYDTALFAARMAHIRRAIPDAFIGVDLMTGTRGETDQLFEQSLQFVESLPISRLHVFPYSERPGTRALGLDGAVSQQEKHRRTCRMLALSERKLAEFASRFEGTVRPVLAEQPREGHPFTGLTDNYLRVDLGPARPELTNRIVSVRLGRMDIQTETIPATIIE